MKHSMLSTMSSKSLVFLKHFNSTTLKNTLLALILIITYLYYAAITSLPLLFNKQTSSSTSSLADPSCIFVADPSADVWHTTHTLLYFQLNPLHSTLLETVSNWTLFYLILRHRLCLIITYNHNIL